MKPREKRSGKTRSGAPQDDGTACSADAAVVRKDRNIALGPLQDRLGYALRRAQQAVFQDFFASFAEHDIRPGQYSTLTVIECNPGLSQTQVADALGIQKANFVAMIVGLEKRKLVRRDQSPADRRTYRLYLTELGAELLVRLHGLALAHEQRIIDLIGRDPFDNLFAPLHTIAQDLRK